MNIHGLIHGIITFIHTVCHFFPKWSLNLLVHRKQVVTLDDMNALIPVTLAREWQTLPLTIKKIYTKWYLQIVNTFNS